MQLTMRELGFATPWWKRILGRGGRHRFTDLWTGESSVTDDVLRKTVPAQGAVMLRIDRGRR